MRIAMWSGPRNLSTAMMYSFAQRSDCSVVDEPFYAAYLAQTGLDHPMRAEILESQTQDPKKVAQELADASGIRYEKHMTHHMLPDWDLDWMADVVNVFLIRHPARVVASYAVKRQNPTAEDLGFQRQFELFDHVRDLGQSPIVVDSFDIRANPRAVLTRLCDAIGVPFDPAMLHWPKGANRADGVWAAHWYGAIHGSSGFAGNEGPLPVLSEQNQQIAEDAMQFYQALSDQKI